MAHQPMHINNWIEIDKDYVWYLNEKARIIQEQGIPLFLHGSLLVEPYILSFI